MRTTSRVIAAAALAATGIVAAPLATVSAATSPSVSVTPAKNLKGGDVVHLAATGILPSTPVRVIQCDEFNNDPETDCPDVSTSTSTTTGGLGLDVTVQSVLLRSQPFGDPLPIYCRADTCQLFVVWTDAGGNTQFAASRPLHFTGAPATISLSQSTNLYRNQTLDVTGTAAGAGPRKMQVSEEACFDIVQGSGCYGQLKVRTIRAQHDGSFSLDYTVHRYLSDGTDCAEPDILGECEVTVTVLNADGSADDSFGMSSRGQPAAWLTFRTS